MVLDPKHGNFPFNAELDLYIFCLMGQTTYRSFELKKIISIKNVTLYL